MDMQIRVEGLAWLTRRLHVPGVAQSGVYVQVTVQQLDTCYLKLSEAQAVISWRHTYYIGTIADCAYDTILILSMACSCEIFLVALRFVVSTTVVCVCGSSGQGVVHGRWSWTGISGTPRHC